MLYRPSSVIPIFSWLAICRPTPSKFLAVCPLGISSKGGFFLNPPNIHSYLYPGRRLLLQILEISSFPRLTSLKMVWVFVSPTVRLFFLLMDIPSASSQAQGNLVTISWVPAHIPGTTVGKGKSPSDSKDLVPSWINSGCKYQRKAGKKELIIIFFFFSLLPYQSW